MRASVEGAGIVGTNRARRTAGAGLFAALLLASASACGTDDDGASPANGGRHASADKPSGSHAERSMVGLDLLTAMKQTADDGKGFGLKDATSLGRHVDPGQARKYVVCFEKVVPRLSAVDLFAVPSDEKCPKKRGAVAPAPETPDAVGKTLVGSLPGILMTGYDPKHIKVFKTSDPDTPVQPKPLADWHVCAQSPKAGRDFDASADVELHVAKKCP
ncbi:hypothetical protein [Streptomyces sp. NPDC001530]|uniref:hypothetical protein n=1 Tax=Streptomyces sp. NPDC001530 TaxID=3364582 RepID=UPI003696711A